MIKYKPSERNTTGGESLMSLRKEINIRSKTNQKRGKQILRRVEARVAGMLEKIEEMIIYNVLSFRTRYIT